ncbi:putative N-acetyltransferase YhbS [Paenibacillus anaericanus]|uniref:GNAT family N-acetyltransferase n=1 Tax=Paenibacillus anaericanus TaxID=170367 RepID=UPI00277D39F8|nr:GNAT family N-acetyltransferase [Paenibacillus anaericanus]MDQ0088085.1 putative N-acetyltransferase YhbS [Paenibacillus anaericanus]
MEFRQMKEHEMKQAAVLANNVFRKDGEIQMEEIFPALFQPGVSHSYGAFDQYGDIVSFMGMVPLIINSGSVNLSAFSIGAVCTHPEYRGQGIASRLLSLCLQHAKDAGASLLFISGDKSLYLRAGSVYFGKSTQFILDPPAARHLVSEQNLWNFRDMKPEDIFAMHDLIKSQTGTIQWGLSDLQQFIGTSPMATLYGLTQYIKVAELPGEGISAFAVVGVPRPDSSPEQHQEQTSQVGTVIEWAGSNKAVTALLSHLLSHFNLTSLEINLPWQYTQLAASLEEAGTGQIPSTNAGTLLVADGNTLITQSRLDSVHGHDLTISIDTEGTYILNSPDGASVIGGDAELCSLLFDPDTEITQPSKFKLKTLPLPYMYGLYFI